MSIARGCDEHSEGELESVARGCDEHSGGRGKTVLGWGNLLFNLLFKERVRIFWGGDLSSWRIMLSFIVSFSPYPSGEKVVGYQSKFHRLSK